MILIKELEPDFDTFPDLESRLNMFHIFKKGDFPDPGYQKYMDPCGSRVQDTQPLCKLLI